MLSEFQQDEVWRKWIAGEIRADYFSDMGRRYIRLHGWLVWLTLFFSAGTVAAMIGSVSADFGWLKFVFGVVVTAISLFSIRMENPKKYAECSDLHFKWNRLAAEYQALWGNVYSEDAELTFANLLEKEAELSKVSMTIPNKPKIMEKWERHVLAHRTGETACA
jgi:hypothetical protein